MLKNKLFGFKKRKIVHCSLLTVNCKKGFTIVEMLVSLTIIGLLSALFFANYRGTGVLVDLKGVSQKLASDVRVAQNNSLGTRKFNNETPLGGWGVYFDLNTPHTYKIFADVNGDYLYDVAEEYSEINLPPQISISELSLDSPVSVVFLPPDPQTYINGENDNNLIITVKERVHETTKQVEVNFLGLIDVIE